MRHTHVKIVALALGVLVAALFFPAVIGRGVFFQRDIHAFWYPHIENAIRAVAEGGLPAWNPYVAFGRPLLADPNFHLLYPPAWINLLVQPWTYYTLFAVSHCWAAGLGAYLLARHHKLSVIPAAVAGALWTSSGPLLSAINLFHHFAGAAWTAWVLLAFERTMERPSLARGLVLGAAAGGQALAGSADLCLLTAVAIAPRLVLLCLAGRQRLRATVAGLGRVLVVAGLFAFLVASIQWLPAISALDIGSRGSLPLAARQAWSMHPASMLDFVVPRLLADGQLDHDLRATLFEGREPLLSCLYLGAASLPLVVLGLFGGPSALRSWMTSAFLVLLLAALGRHTPFHGLLASVPPYSILRYPVKYMIPAALCWAMLAGLGLETWRRSWTGAQRRRGTLIAVSTLVLAVGAAVAAFWIGRQEAGTFRPAVGKVLHAAMAAGAAGLLLLARTRHAQAVGPSAAVCGALAVLELGAVGRHVNILAPSNFFRFRPPLAAALTDSRPEPRLFARAATLPTVRDAVQSALAAQQALVPPLGARWRIAGSFDGDFTGQAGAVEGTLFATALRLDDHPGLLALLQVAGVTHVASFGPAPVSGLRETGSFETLYGEPVRLHEVPRPHARAYMAYVARRLTERDLPMLMDPAFAASGEVILPPLAPVLPSPSSPAPRGSVRFRRPTLDSLELDIETTDAGWLVVLEASHPGWTAEVDNVPTPIVTANFLFRAVPVAAGTHLVHMRYRTPGLAAGLLLSSAALVLGAAVAVRHHRAALGLRAGAGSDTMPR
jgi:hypothetical protein